MEDFRKHHSKTHYLLRFAATLLGTIVLFATAGVAVSSAWNMYGTFSVAAGAREEAEQALRSAQDEQTRISAAVAGFTTDAGIDREVRERFGVAKLGEGEIRIVREASAEDSPEEEEQNIFTRTLHSLFVW
jgi:hypothetical protein